MCYAKPKQKTDLTVNSMNFRAASFYYKRSQVSTVQFTIMYFPRVLEWTSEPKPPSKDIFKKILISGYFKEATYSA